jgi:hypothetical protein
MAIGIVDLLEMIEVDHGNGQLAAAAPHPGDVADQRGFQGASVEHPGQDIMVQFVAGFGELFLDAFQFAPAFGQLAPARFEGVADAVRLIDDGAEQGQDFLAVARFPEALDAVGQCAMAFAQVARRGFPWYPGSIAPPRG